MALDYETWIRRERRLRTRILRNSLQIQATHVFRVCRDCGEVCLCHEQVCPNCGGAGVVEQKLGADKVATLETKIRCRKRFEKLE